MAGSRSRPLLFLILLFFSTGAMQAVELELSAAGAGLAAAASGYPALIQGSGALRFGAQWPVGTTIALGSDLLVAGANASDAGSWFTYRGWSGWGLEATGSASWQVATSPRLGSLRAGAGVAAGLALLTYSSTTLVFLCPTLEVAGLLRYTPPSLPYLDFSLEVPIRAWLRADLSYCISLGLGLGCTFSTSRFGARP